MLSLSPDAWDVFFVYPSDFIRHVNDIIACGMDGRVLSVRPFLPVSPSFQGRVWSDFAWGPDGSYSAFCQAAALVFIIVTVARRLGVSASRSDGSVAGLDEGPPELPEWLIQDLSSMSAVYVYHGGGDLQRAFNILRQSIFQSHAHRAVDPILGSSMIASLKENYSNNFIKKYNAQVFYVRDLMLQNNSAWVQGQLMDRTRCTEEMTNCMVKRIDKVRRMDDSGLSQKIMRLPDFWVGKQFVKTSHPQLSLLFVTTPWSCLQTLCHLFDKADAGRSISSDQYAAFARKAAIFDNLRRGTFARLQVDSGVQDSLWTLVAAGAYDIEFAEMMSFCDDDVPLIPKDMDAFLLERSGMLQTAMEGCQTEGASPQPGQQGPDSAAVSVASVATSPAERFLALLEKDVSEYGDFVEARAETMPQLRAAEESYAQGIRPAALAVAKVFADKYVPMMPYRGDYRTFLEGLPKIVEDRLQEIASHCSCNVGDILRVCWFDLTSLGAPTATNLDFCGKGTATVAGSRGLAMILCSDTPAGKGRPGTGMPKKADASSEPLGGSQASSMLGSLPPAPSNFQHLADQAQRKAFMVNDLQSILKLGSNIEGRFGQPVQFWYKSKEDGDVAHVQCVGVQPSSSGPWQGMRLFQQSRLEGIEPPSSWVDLGPSSARDARCGRIQRVAVKSKLINKNCRFARGADLCSSFLDDVRRASQALTKETGRMHPICFVDLTSWIGDTVEACLDKICGLAGDANAEPNADAEPNPDGSAVGVGSSADRSVLCPSAARSAVLGASADRSGKKVGEERPPIYATFFDKKDPHYQISKARRDMRIQRAFRGSIVAFRWRANEAEPALASLEGEGVHFQLALASFKHR